MSTEGVAVEDGTFIIGRYDRRRHEGEQPAAGAERRRGRRGYIEVEHPTVSQVHAELIVLGGSCYLADLGSTNGTWILRDGSLEAFREGYVELDTPLQFGDCPRTVRQLLRAVESPASAE